MQKNKKKGGKKKGPVAGVIFVNRRGIGYVSIEKFEKDIEIHRNNLNTALNGDTVFIKIVGKKKGHIEGVVKKIVKRAKNTFVGTLIKEDDAFLLKPDDGRMYANIVLPKNEIRSIPLNTKLVVNMKTWTDPRSAPQGNVIKVLGQKGQHEVEMQSIIFEHGFDPTFVNAIENEAKKISKSKTITKEDSNRRDMRGVITFTIDPKDAKDFDDAISIVLLQNGDIEIGIHIADVTHYVLPGSLIDKEAQKRATSVYLVDRTIPMLPEILSNDVCSLNEGEDRRTFSAIFILSPEAKVKSKWFGETVTHSNKRFTYEEAQKILKDGKGLLYNELNKLNFLAKKIRTRRIKKGAFVFEQDEVQFDLDEKGKPVRIYKKKRQDTNLMIEDFMLLANEEVATYMYEHSKKTSGKDNAFVYRIHDTPDPEKIEELGIFIRAIGYEFDTKEGVVSAHDINKLFKQIEGKPEENLIKVATIRSMAKAVYSTKNIGHFGLAFKYYTHFTSPIRRYPDILVHRILKNHLRGGPVSDKEIAEYNYLAIQSSAREVEAIRAERDSIKYKQVEYMQDHIGEKFSAVITGVTEWGVYVEEKETRAEGLVPMRAIGEDYYVLDQKKYRIVGERSKKKFALGDSVKVKLMRADLDARTLNFEFV